MILLCNFNEFANQYHLYKKGKQIDLLSKVI